MDAMSSVFIIESELICESSPDIPIPEEVETSPRGKPSTTMRGDVEPESEAAPRMSILDAAPGWPLVEDTISPATPPLSASSTENITWFLRLSELMDATEPVRS